MEQFASIPIYAHEVAIQAHQRFHCVHCRSRSLQHYRKRQTILYLALTNDDVVEVHRHFIISKEPVYEYPAPDDTFELVVIDMVAEDSLEPKFGDVMPSFGFTYRVCHEDHQEVTYYMRALSCFSPHAETDAEFDEPKISANIELYGDGDFFPYLREVCCRKAVNNFLGRLDLTEYLIIEHNPILETVLNIATMDFSRNVPHLYCPCPTPKFELGDFLRVYIYLQVNGEDNEAIRVERNYRFCLDKAQYRGSDSTRLMLIASEFINCDEVPDHFVPKLREIGFHFITLRDHDMLGSAMAWYTRAITCFHPSPLATIDLANFRLSPAVEMFAGHVFTKFLPVMCPKAICEIMAVTNVSTVHKLQPIDDPNKVYHAKRKNHHAYRLKLHDASCKTCSKGEKYEVASCFTSRTWKLPMMDINTEVQRFVHLSSAAGNEKLDLQGRLELVLLDLIPIENILERNRKFLPFMGFNSKFSFTNPCFVNAGQEYYGRAMYGQFIGNTNEINMTSGELLRRASTFHVPHFNMLTTVDCIESMINIVNRIKFAEGFTIYQVDHGYFSYPERTLNDYIKHTRPIIPGTDCVSCLRINVTSVYKLRKQIILRVAPMKLEVPLSRFFHLVSRPDSTYFELEVVDFVKSRAFSRENIDFLNVFGFTCEVKSKLVDFKSSKDYYCRAFRAKVSCADAKKAKNYFTLLNELKMYGGNDFSDFHLVTCPQTVCVYMTRFGLKDVLIRKCTPILNTDRKFGVRVEHS